MFLGSHNISSLILHFPVFVDPIHPPIKWMLKALPLDLKHPEYGGYYLPLSNTKA